MQTSNTTVTVEQVLGPLEQYDFLIAEGVKDYLGGVADEQTQVAIDQGRLVLEAAMAGGLVLGAEAVTRLAMGYLFGEARPGNFGRWWIFDLDPATDPSDESMWTDEEIAEADERERVFLKVYDELTDGGRLAVVFDPDPEELDESGHRRTARGLREERVLYLDLINVLRQRHGRASVAWSGNCAIEAQHRAFRLAATGLFVHIPQLLERMQLRVPQVRFVNENLASVPRGDDGTWVRAALALWVRSAGHWANILDVQMTHIGLGVYGYLLQHRPSRGDNIVLAHVGVGVS